MVQRLNGKLECARCRTVYLCIPDDVRSDSPIFCTACGSFLGRWSESPKTYGQRLGANTPSIAHAPGLTKICQVRQGFKSTANFLMDRPSALLNLEKNKNISSPVLLLFLHGWVKWNGSWTTDLTAPTAARSIWIFLKTSPTTHQFPVRPVAHILVVGVTWKVPSTDRAGSTESSR